MRQTIKIAVYFSFLLPLFLLFFIAWIKPLPRTDLPISSVSENAPGLAVLELFTSQGCSSCPPADAILGEYTNAKNSQIITLSFHVDYWNRLGWVDPFSNKIYSERQQWYSQHLPNGSIYTPQLIVNGKAEVVGNNRVGVKSLIEKQLAIKQNSTVDITSLIVDKNLLNCSYQVRGSFENSLINFVLVEKNATTNIRAGENKGLTMTNRNIVRQFVFKSATEKGDQAIALPKDFSPQAYSLVVYLQNKNTGEIKAAVQKEVEAIRP